MCFGAPSLRDKAENGDAAAVPSSHNVKRRLDEEHQEDRIPGTTRNVARVRHGEIRP
ncbi:hypothetical protein PAXINDRAFT_170775 [Paxillus involutus ATCC 200175]|uniref:Uncharacterized protein n=1 Tax=Paxillus involutus ATCC 200175 TaxID=664439 RepID=A0A0C9U110_PAXIN|nr:hypothetical protein PAXINDRAFT_170775 [Paxillus involutus ATCC 200175]